jgi:hypothetical protein
MEKQIFASFAATTWFLRALHHDHQCVKERKHGQRAYKKGDNGPKKDLMLCDKVEKGRNIQYRNEQLCMLSYALNVCDQACSRAYRCASKD